MIKVPSRVPILPWESPLHLKESAPSLCSTSESTGLNLCSAGIKQETPRPTASNPLPGSTSATTTKATTKNNIRTHPHPGLRPLSNKQNRRSSRPTGKTNRPTPRLLPRMLGFPTFPLFKFGLTHRYKDRGRREDTGGLRDARTPAKSPGRRRGRVRFRTRPRFETASCLAGPSSAAFVA